MTSLIKFRKDFPGIKKFKAYLNTASEGLTPKQVTDYLINVLMELTNPYPGIEEELDYIVKNARYEIAKLIGAKHEEIAFTIQTTDGLKRVLSGLRIGPRDNIVSVDLEFPTIATLLTTLCRSRGCEIRVVNGNGIYDLDDFRKFIDENTKAVVLSSVQWITGWRLGIRDIGELVHEAGAVLIVDGVQHVGALQINVKKENIDVLCAGGEKWLLNPYIGSGFMYVTKELIDEFDIGIYGLHNTIEPEGGWTNYWPDPNKEIWEIRDVSSDASKFEWGGGKPYLLIAALMKSVEYINKLGIDAIENKIMSLKRYLINEVYRNGLSIIGYNDDHRTWSGITLISTGLNPKKELNIVENLRKEGIIVSYRGASGISGIRVSTHFYNSREDIDVFIKSLSRYLAGK